MSKTGICHICGLNTELSFEHIPPQKAFNDQTVLMIDIYRWLNLTKGKKVKPDISQKGMGGYTLCKKCNNDTGSWYGADFVEWCKKAFLFLERTNYNPTLFCCYEIHPLRIIKQIITLFFSANGPNFSKDHKNLVKFVLNKEYNQLSSKYNIYIYYNIIGHGRLSGIQRKYNLDKRELTLIGEISYPPFGYVLTINSIKKPDNRLFNINHFSKYNYYEKAYISVDSPVLETHTIYPGDYRNIKEIEKDVAKNNKWPKSKQQAHDLIQGECEVDC